MIGGAVGELLAGMEKALRVFDPEALSGPGSLELFDAFHLIERWGRRARGCAPARWRPRRPGSPEATARPVI